MIQIPLEARKDSADLFWLSQLDDGISNGVVVFEIEQRYELFLVEFIYADLHVMREHKVEKCLLLAVELGGNRALRVGRPFLAAERGDA